MSRDMIKLQLSQHFCRATKYPVARHEFHGIDIMLRLLHITSALRLLHALSVCLLLQCCDTRQFFGVVRYIIKHLFYKTT